MIRRTFVRLSAAVLLVITTALAASLSAAPAPSSFVTRHSSPITTQRAVLSPAIPGQRAVLSPAVPGQRAVLSPNGLIAFVSARDGNAEVYTMNPDGSDPVNLTENDAADYEPVWSPDGTKIAFRSDRDGNDEIYVMDADGGNPIRLTNDAVADFQPTWSPDGMKIAFTRELTGNQEIFVVDAGGGTPVNLTETDSPLSEREADWSPDGTKIAYSQWNAGNLEVYVMDADGGNQTNLTNNPTSSDEEPAWSPDGTKIAFSSYRDGNQDIHVMDADGDNPTNLTEDEATDWYAAWSPDGTQIAFASDRDGSPNPAVFTMNATGGDQTNRTGAGFNYQPDWGPAPEDDDGVPPDVEDGAPNGGDGNDDGTPDSEQAHVASLPNSEDGTYLTLAAPDGTQMTAVEAIDNPSPGNTPEGAAFPLGFLSFSVEGITNGAAVTVDVFIESDAGVDTYYKYGPTAADQTAHWYEFLDDGTTGAEPLADRWRLRFVDGGRGDSDLQANGIITDPGGIARRPVVVCTPLTNVVISGHNAVDVNQPLVLNAQISPTDATLPITYQWSVGHTAGQGTPQATYQWAAVGPQTVAVTASNCDGAAEFTDEHAVTVSTATPTVRVNDEGGSPVAGAAVYRNGQLAGHTDADGLLPMANLAVGDELVARQMVYQRDSSSPAHDGWAYRVYITSLDVPITGEPVPHKVAGSATTTLVVKKGNTLVGFNLVVSVAWDANTTYLVQLKQGYELASKYLYDAGDGQMVFEKVSIYDNGEHFQQADIGIVAAKGEGGSAVRVQARIVPPPAYGFTRYQFGRTFDGRNGDLTSWTTQAAYRELARGFAFYGFELQPSTYYYNPAQVRVDGYFCTTPDIVTNGLDDVNASLMTYPANATEFAMQNFSGLWEETCKQTRQWQVYGKSDWEAIKQVMSDFQQPARWTFKTPTDRGGLTAGPHLMPVAAWTSAAVAGNADTGVCAAPQTYVMKVPSWFELQTAGAVLLQPVPLPGAIIDQGATDASGRITVVGARPGDTIVFSGRIRNVSCDGFGCVFDAIRGTLTTIQPVVCNVERGLAGTADEPPIVVELEQQPFTPEVSVAPGSGPNQVRVTTTMTVTLDGPPVVTLAQNGAPESIAVPMSAAGVGTYTGLVTLNIGYEPVGVVHIAADAGGDHVETFTTFAVTPVEAAQDTTVASADGRAELFLPAGSLSDDGRLNIEQSAAPGEFPEGLRAYSGPYIVIHAAGVSLTDTATLTLRHNPRASFDPATTRLYRWNGTDWTALTGTQGPDSVSAAVNAFGVYVLLAEPEYRLYTPTIRR